MQVYLKTFAAWRTARQATAIASSLVIDSLDAENSSVTVDGTEIGNGNTGDWIIVNGMVYQLSAVKPQTDRTVLTLSNLIDSFSRPLELPETIPAGQTIGGFIKDVITSNWIQSDDPLFAIPYLTVVSDDATPLELPELDKSGLYVLSDYIRLVRRTHRVTVTFSPTESGILCRIRNEPEVYRQITFNDGRSQIYNVSYSRSGQSKLTVLHDVDTGEKDGAGEKITVRERSTWYLAEDGSISDTPPARRAHGSWGTLVVSGSNDVETKVAETFAKNKSTHKVEFYSELDLPVGADCLFRVYGDNLRSQISYKAIQNGDSRWFYRSGELAVTATDKLRGVLK